jgi:hypothetical protein
MMLSSGLVTIVKTARPTRLARINIAEFLSVRLNISVYKDCTKNNPAGINRGAILYFFEHSELGAFGG